MVVVIVESKSGAPTVAAEAPCVQLILLFPSCSLDRCRSSSQHRGTQAQCVGRPSGRGSTHLSAALNRSQGRPVSPNCLVKRAVPWRRRQRLNLDREETRRHGAFLPGSGVNNGEGGFGTIHLPAGLCFVNSPQNWGATEVQHPALGKKAWLPRSAPRDDVAPPQRSSRGDMTEYVHGTARNMSRPGLLSLPAAVAR